jgi:hypothetical protein
MGDYPTPGLILQNPSEKGTFLILQRLCVKWCTKQIISINHQDWWISPYNRKKEKNEKYLYIRNHFDGADSLCSAPDSGGA